MNNTQEISAKLFIKTAYRFRYHCMGIIFLIMGGINIGVLFLPKTYTASATIMNISDDRMGGGASAGSILQFVKMGRQVNDGFFKFIAIVNSRTFQEQVVESLGPDFFIPKEGWKGSPEELKGYGAGIVGRGIRLKVEPDQSNVLNITVTTKDPEMAPKIANQILFQLQRYVSENSLTEAKRLRNYIEDNIIETKVSIFETTKLMASFYKKYAVNPQNKMVEDPLSKDAFKLSSQKFEEITANPLLKHSAGLLSEKRDALLKRLNEIKEVPEQSYFDYLQEEYQILKEINLTLRQQYEVAKLDVIKQEPAFQVLDNAVGSGYTGPNRREVFYVSLATSLLIAALYVFSRLFYTSTSFRSAFSFAERED